MEFPAETAQSMNDFRADDQVGNISPRPLLLIHSANDSVTPTYESIEMFKKAQATGRAASVVGCRPFYLQRRESAPDQYRARMAGSISRWEAIVRSQPFSASLRSNVSGFFRGTSAENRPPQLLSFCNQFLSAGGMPADDADLVAELLVRGELRGYAGHGVIRVGQYLIGSKTAPTDRRQAANRTRRQSHRGRSTANITSARSPRTSPWSWRSRKPKSRRRHCLLRRAGHTGRLADYMEMATRKA